MIFNIVQNFPIQIFNGHCYALKTSLDYITYHVPMTLAVKNDVSVLFERCITNVKKVGTDTDRQTDDTHPSRIIVPDGIYSVGDKNLRVTG